MKSRVLYIVHAYDNRGGTEEHTKALARGLLSNYETWACNPEQSTITLRKDGAILNQFPVEAPLFPVTPYRVKKTEAALAQIFHIVKPDIIHIQHFINWPLSVIDQCVGTGKPVIVSFHDYYSITPHYLMQGIEDPREVFTLAYCQHNFQVDLVGYLIKRREIIENSLKRVTHRITPSRYLACQLNTIYPNEYRIIPHGIARYTPKPTTPEVGNLRFGYIGNLIPHKGWASLCQAFSQVHEKYPHTWLTFYGGGQEQPHNVPKGVTFTGPYDQNYLPKIMSEFDIGVIPSVFAETFCLALSELWLAGKPVAVSDIGALSERIQDGINGKVFIPGNIDSIVEVLSWFVECDEWSYWSTSAVRGADEMVSDYDQLYRSCLTDHSQRTG